MEWVETTGRTVDEAKDAALDQLGVDEQDAEFEVLEDAKSGLFGRLRQEARVRARVRPTTPRPKVDRRDRKRKPAGDAAPAEEAPVAKAAPRKRAPKKEAPAEPVAKAPAKKAAAKKTTKTAAKATTTTGAVPMEDLDLDAQAANVRSFLEGLVLSLIHI